MHSNESCFPASAFSYHLDLLSRSGFNHKPNRKVTPVVDTLRWHSTTPPWGAGHPANKPMACLAMDAYNDLMQALV